jgi:flagellar basal body-associated protein FliL
MAFYFSMKLEKKKLEEGLLLILAVFAIAVVAIFFFFSKKFVYNHHLENQQILTLQTYKACPKSSCRKAG